MSFSSFYQPRLTQPPATDDVKVLVPWIIQQLTPSVNGIPPFSQFSWPSPNSNVSALAGTIGINYASNTSVIWVKVTGSGKTGWSPIMYDFPGAAEEDASAHVHNSSSSFPVSKTSATVMTFDITDFDTSSMYDGASKFVIPSTGNISGTWELRAQVTWAPAAAGGRQCDLYRNGVVLYSNHVLGSNDTQSQRISGMIHNPTAGDFFQVVVTQSSAATLNILTEPEHSFFEAMHL